MLFVLCTGGIPPVLSDPVDAAGWFAVGQNLTNTGNYSGALYAYNQSLTLDPTNAAVWNGVADVLNRENFDTSNPLATLNMALDASNQSLALNGTSATAWINHGMILYNIGSYYQRQFNDKNTANMYYNLQLDAFNKAIYIAPDNADAWFNKAYALCGMERCSEGLVAFQHVETLDPDYPNLQANINIAEKVAAAETPFYVKYAAEIAMVVIAGIVAMAWYIAVRKKY
jgi:tetratricopeptide (TPR) repeat protein